MSGFVGVRGMSWYLPTFRMDAIRSYGSEERRGRSDKQYGYNSERNGRDTQNRRQPQDRSTYKGGRNERETGKGSPSIMEWDAAYNEGSKERYDDKNARDRRMEYNSKGKNNSDVKYYDQEYDQSRSERGSEDAHQFRDRERDRDRNKDRNRDILRDREIERELERARYGDRSDRGLRDRERPRSPERERDWGRDRERGRNLEKDTRRGSERDRSTDRSRERERDPYRDRERRRDDVSIVVRGSSGLRGTAVNPKSVFRSSVLCTDFVSHTCLQLFHKEIGQVESLQNAEEFQAC